MQEQNAPQESEWGLHAQRGGKITTVAAIACMIIGFVMHRVWGALWALAVALILSSFETPFLYGSLEVSHW